jgi:hypothetical protein
METGNLVCSLRFEFLLGFPGGIESSFCPCFDLLCPVPWVRVFRVVLLSPLLLFLNADRHPGDPILVDLCLGLDEV